MFLPGQTEEDTRANTLRTESRASGRFIGPTDENISDYGSMVNSTGRAPLLPKMVNKEKESG